MVTLALLVLFGLFKGLIDLIAGDTEEDEASMRNFQELARQVNEMETGKSKEMPIYVSKDKFIVGFERDKATASAVGCPDLDYKGKHTIYKPAVCGSKPCLCLCDNKYSCRENKEIDCITKFDTNFDFRGGASCNAALVPGNTKPQTIFILKQKDYVKICSEECS